MAHMYGMFLCAFGSYFRVRSSSKKNLFKNLGFFSPSCKLVVTISAITSEKLEETSSKVYIDLFAFPHPSLHPLVPLTIFPCFIHSFPTFYFSILVKSS